MRRFVLLVLLTVAMVGGRASAYTTVVYDTTHGTEEDLHAGLPTHPDWQNEGGSEEGFDDLLDRIYPGNYQRIDDSFDQIWLDMDGTCQVMAIYAADEHKLGYSLDETDGSPVAWLNGSYGGDLDQLNETASFDIEPDTDAFIWVLGCIENYYSIDMLNWDSRDHMVSFKITDLQDTYVIAWDNGGTDQDYQDIVFEIRNVANVPEPATLLLLGLGTLALLRKRTA